jgi:hypothetical protein
MAVQKQPVRLILVIIGLLSLLLLPRAVRAHCDTMDGPVVTAAKEALEKGDAAGLFKWIKKEHEPDVLAAFKKTLAVRAAGPEARELADMYFFETVVRLHRAGEGEPYTGIKPAGTDPRPGITASDKALESGSADAVVKMVTDKIAAGIRERHAQAFEAKKHANESVEAGRKFVEAYLQYMHYVEQVLAASQAQHEHHAAAQSASADHEHRCPSEGGKAAR